MTSEDQKRPGLLAVITGPTASGKGEVAHRLARRTGCEIICMDSMKVYREMDVGTAKPSTRRRAEVPYHLVDIVDPEVDFSVGDYLERLEATLEDIERRGAAAVLVGGTALYLKACLHGFRKGPPADWDLRVRLKGIAREHGTEALHSRLAALDPKAAGKIHARDLRRIVRALEVLETTGQPISDGWDWDGTATEPGPVPASTRIFGLEWDRGQLYRRIDARVDAMVARGLFAEVERLSRRSPPLSRSASQSIGVKEVLAGHAAGLRDDEIITRIQQGTRRFAKSQLTWFRKLPVEWVPTAEGDDPDDLASEVLERLQSVG